jgi:hypothetical protein
MFIVQACATMILNYNRNTIATTILTCNRKMFIVKATTTRILNYNCNMFIVQATGEAKVDLTFI